MPSLHQLLPEYACIEHGGDLAKTTERHPPRTGHRHGGRRDAVPHRPAAGRGRAPAEPGRHPRHRGHHPAHRHHARLTGGRIELLDTYRDEDLAGDATVPIVGACRADVPMDSNTLRRVPDKHGNLQRNPAALDEVEGILTARPVKVRAAGVIEAAVDLPELILAGEPLPIRVRLSETRRAAVRITVTDESSHLAAARVITPPATTSVESLAPGVYTVGITGLSASPVIAPVTSTVLVWRADEGTTGG